MFTNLFINAMLCLNLTRLIVESKFEFELDLFVKQTYKQVFSRAVHKQLDSFITLGIINIIP